MPDTSPSQISLPFAGADKRAFSAPRPHARLSRLARSLSRWRERQLVRRALALADAPTLVLDLHAADGQYRPVLAEKPNRVIVTAGSADGMGGGGHRLALLHELKRVTRDTAIVSSGGDAGGRDFAAAGFRILGQLDFLPLCSPRRLYVLRKFEL